jgi:hypothetical protein
VSKDLEKRAYITLIHAQVPKKSIRKAVIYRSAYNENKKGMKKIILNALKNGVGDYSWPLQ